MIVPTPCPSAITAPVGLDRLTVNVSFDSAVVSPLIVMAICALVVPGANVTNPDFDTKSCAPVFATTDHPAIDPESKPSSSFT